MINQNNPFDAQPAIEVLVNPGDVLYGNLYRRKIETGSRKGFSVPCWSRTEKPMNVILRPELGCRRGLGNGDFTMDSGVPVNDFASIILHHATGNAVLNKKWRG